MWVWSVVMEAEVAERHFRFVYRWGLGLARE